MNGASWGATDAVNNATLQPGAIEASMAPQPSSAPLRLAVVEAVGAPPSSAANLMTGLLTLARAAEAGARLVVFPEVFLCGSLLDRSLFERAAAADEGLHRLAAAGEELGVDVIVGAALLRNERLLNVAAALRPGRPAEHYVKTHLYTGEEEWFAPGSSLWQGPVADWPCGIAICYELGFPEIARTLVLRGARLLLAPSAWGAGRRSIWEVATVSRALENGCFLAAANQCGWNGEREFLGSSRIVDPFGRIIAGEGAPDIEVRGRGGLHRVWLADLDPGQIEEARGGRDGWHKYLSDRRPELYDSGPRRASV